MSEKFRYESKIEKSSLKIKILNMLAEIGFVDEISQRRAIDIVEKSKIREHLKPDGVYLDIGTGFGHIVERIVREEEDKNVKFLALDPAWKPLKKVRKRLAKEAEGRVSFMKAIGEQLPIKDKSLDGVSLFFVLHHTSLEGQSQIFNEIKRVLKENGLLFLIEDTPGNEQEREGNAKWDRRLNFESKDEKHYYQSNEEWREFFKKNDFELIESAYFEDISPKKNEGIIRHGSYILRCKH
jgi:ubiquinone/menaquinone biosynthesis C-methylase UbiE